MHNTVCCCLGPRLTRANYSDLELVQQLINDSVSLLVYSGSEGEEEGEESDGSLRSGAGEGVEGGGSERRGSRRRARPGGYGSGHGEVHGLITRAPSRLRFFLTYQACLFHFFFVQELFHAHHPPPPNKKKKLIVKTSRRFKELDT